MLETVVSTLHVALDMFLHLYVDYALQEPNMFHISH